QYLTILCLGTEPSSQVAHGADCGVAGALGKADLSKRGVALCNADSKAQITIASTPGSDQGAGRLAHRYRHFDRPLGGVRDRHRVVKEHHDPIARKLVERALELANKRPQRAVIFAQEIEHLLGLGGFGKGGVATQIAEHDNDFASMAFEDFFVAL